MRNLFVCKALILCIMFSCDPDEQPNAPFSPHGNPLVAIPVIEEPSTFIIQGPIQVHLYQDTLTINTFNFSSLVLPYGEPENQNFIVHMDNYRVRNINGGNQLEPELLFSKSLEIFDPSGALITVIDGTTWDCRIDGQLVDEGIYRFKGICKTTILTSNPPTQQEYYNGRGQFEIAYCYDPNLHNNHFLPSETSALRGIENNGSDANVCP